MISHLLRENCSHCLKNIYICQQTFECSKCNTIAHTKCYKKSKSAIIAGEYYCAMCKVNIEPRYNPFREIIEDNCEDSNQNNEILQISSILNKCSSTKVLEFNTFAKANVDNKKHSSSYFLNISIYYNLSTQKS